jgi:hypothetical protein
MMYGLKPKPVRICPTCHTEHYGKCHFLRSKKHAKANAEEVARWNEAQRQRKALFHAQKLIKELCDAVETGRRTARPTGWLGRKPGPKSRLDLATDQRASKRNTITRKRTSED